MNSACCGRLRAALLLVLLLTSLGCREDESSEETLPPVIGSVKGVSISPRSFGQADFEQFLGLVADGGDWLTWAGDWIQLGDTSAGPHAVETFEADYHFSTVPIATLFGSDLQPLRPLSDSMLTAYASQAAFYARRYYPEFMGLGIEVNRIYDSAAPDAYQAFVEFFPRAADSVKAASPDTRVFTVFQLEWLKGLRGGLYGGVNDTTRNQWQLAADFPAADFIALTTYPGLIYRDPTEIPADYYAGLAARLGKPIAFTEVGWHSAASPAGWESSEGEQAEFLTRWISLIAPLDPVLVIWPFLFDPAAQEPFNTMGLWRTSDGQAKAAWLVWSSANL
ncbi:hypothetical protein HZB60_10565 [candidate division KSB1 bacterium]|nr:hypothetical protein [candidate division KSB1 bacterium]